jgi:membrane associated rhomboid family serine protease
MIFPLGDDNRDRRSIPVVNLVLIAANVLVFVLFQGVGTNLKFTMAFSTVPAEIITGKDLKSDDRIEVVQTVDGPRQIRVPGLQETPIPVYLTLLTSMFMHGGLAHLAGNMWFLWIFGDNIEDDLGHGRYLGFYILTGILASLTHVAVSAGGPSADVPSLGASGAISGVLGAYLLLHPHRQVTVLLLRIIVNVPGYAAVGLWFVFQVISGLGLLGGGAHGGGVAYGAHIGGFIAGAILARPFLIGRSRPTRDTPASEPHWSNW